MTLRFNRTVPAASVRSRYLHTAVDQWGSFTLNMPLRIIIQQNDGGKISSKEFVRRAFRNHYKKASFVIIHLSAAVYTMSGDLSCGLPPTNSAAMHDMIQSCTVHVSNLHAFMSSGLPMIGRLVRSRSPPQPKTTRSRPWASCRAVLRTFSRPSGVCA